MELEDCGICREQRVSGSGIFDQLRNRVTGGFGHGGHDIHRYPGAR
jgi:hypothetical protein